MLYQIKLVKQYVSLCLIILLGISCADLVFASSSTSSYPAITYVGTFTNIRPAGENQHGFQISLWQQKNTVVGILYNAEGLAGATPRGYIQNIQLQPKSGKLSFDAKLTTGMHTCDEHKNVPSQDLFSFKGVLQRNAIKGRITFRNVLHSAATEQSVKVTLARDKTQKLESYDSIEDWQQHYAAEMQQYGPKW